MIKYFTTLQNKRGDALAGYRVQVVDSSGATVSIYADASGTLFDGSVNYATADSEGLVEFYWTPAAGQVLQTLDPTGNLIKAVADFADVGGGAVVFQAAGVSSAVRTIEAKARETLSTADKSGTFLAQMQSVGTDLAAGGTARIPSGSHTLSAKFTFAGNRLNLEGDGRQVTQVAFDPASADVAFELNAGGATIDQSSIKRIAFVSSNSVQKTAIDVYNVANLLISEVAMNATGWLGSGSIGIRTRGRQFVHIERCEILTARPIVFSPNTVFATLGVDHFIVEHCELGTMSAAGTTIELEDGVPISNLTIKNNAIMLGKTGIKGIDTTSGAAGFALKIEGNRFEQADDPTGFCIDLDYTTYGLANLNCIGNRYDLERNGVKLRGVKKAIFIGDQFPQNGALVAVDIAIPVGGELHFIGCQGNGGTRTITNGRCVSRSVDANSLNWTEHWVYDASFASGAQQSDVYHGGVPFSIADGAAQAIADSTFTGMVFISSSEDVSACFILRGGTATTAEVFDPDGFYSITKDTASSLNVYWDAPSSRYVVQNKRGSTLNVSVFRIGTTA